MEQVILKDKWYVIHPAGSGPQSLKVVVGAEITAGATDVWGQSNSIDYVYRGPFDTKRAANEEKQRCHRYNWALWGSADDDKPGDNNRR